MKQLLAIIVMALIPVLASAQSWMRMDDYPMGAQGRVYPAATSAGDSITIPLRYTGNNQTIIQGTLPDSIRVTSFGASDSNSCDWDVKFSAGPANYWTYLFADSLSTLGTKGAKKSTLLTQGVWYGYDVIGLAVKSRALGSGGRAATPTRQWVRIERYFRIPPK